MADLLFVVITIAFFVLCVGYVNLCDRIIGTDPSPRADEAEEPAADRAAVQL